MLRCVYAILCRDVIVDKDSNSMTYVRTVEVGAAPAFPSVMPPLYVATLWELDPAVVSGFEVRLRKVAPEGKESVLANLRLPETRLPRHRVNLHLAGLPVEGPGRHAIFVEFRTDGEWEIGAELPLQVTQQRQQRPGQPVGRPQGGPVPGTVQ